MKKFLSVLGAIFLVLLVGVGYAAFNGFRLDSESRAYVHATLPKVLANSTTENFVSFMAPEDKEKINSAAMIAFYSYISSNFGVFQSCDDDLSGGSFVNVSTSGKSTTATYYARCHFSKASVTATVSLKKTGSNWTLLAVFFDNNSVGPTVKDSGKSGQPI